MSLFASPANIAIAVALIASTGCVRWLLLGRLGVAR
jgi:hypothetical protein